MKYLVTEHSERNALFNAAAKGISTEGATMYVATLGNRLFVCADCARGIIQSGIHQVVIPKPDYSEQWGESCDIAFAMLRECGVEVRILE